MNWSWLVYALGEKYLGRKVRPKLKELRHWVSLPDDQRRRLSLKKLHEILVWANTTVPYYRDLFREVHFNPDLVLKSSEEFQKIPYLTKDTLREQGHRMLSEKYDPARLHARKTNGSTGISTDIFYDTECLDWAAATNLLTYDYTGRKMSDREIHLSTRYVDQPSLKNSWEERMRCIAMGRLNVHTDDLTERGLKELLAQLMDAKAYQVQGHPSTMYYLALYAKENGLGTLPLARAFESTGETLDGERAQIIQETLGCKVYNRYGNAEFGVLAHSSHQPADLEVFDFNVWIENRVLEDGRKEIVGTGLMNHAMPLIRYQTGDIGTLSIRDRKPILSNITGRIHDVIEIRGEPHPTHFVKDILERWGGIDEWQIVLGHGGQHRLRIVPNSSINRDFVATKSREVFGPEYAVEFIELSELKFTGWREKFRYVTKEADYLRRS